MAESFLRRCRRLAHSITDRSAIRTMQFIFNFRRHPPRSRTPWINGPGGEIESIMPITNVAAADRVPPIIFQTWKSRRDIPDNYRYWRQRFVDLNPDATVILWDDDDNRQFIQHRYPWFLQTYDAYPKEIFRADAVRFFFLFEFGGLYADMDSECLRPLDLANKEGHVILGMMGADSKFAHSIPNAIMASKPRQIFWLLAIKRMMTMAQENTHTDKQNNLGPEEMTGPVLLKRTVDLFLTLSEAEVRSQVSNIFAHLDREQRASARYGPITLLPRQQWYPLDWTNAIHKKLRVLLLGSKYLLTPEEATKLFPDAEIVTYWSHSW